MGRKIQLSEAALSKIIKESVLAELDRRKVMPAKYYDIFKSRVINAMHSRFGEVERVVTEFYKDFRDRIPNEDFTFENLMELAEKIEDWDNSAGREWGNTEGHKVKNAEGWWAVNKGKFLEEGKIKLSESQLRNLIKESVKKTIMNEISSDMIRRASKKFQEKYGWGGTDRDKLEKDEYGNPLHPKDKKFIGDHLKNFSNAYNRAKYDEDMQNPLLRKAQEMYRKVDLEQEVSDWADNYGCDVNLWGEIEDENGGLWKFEGWGSGVNIGGGDIEIDHVEEMNFESPDGQTGSIPRP